MSVLVPIALVALGSALGGLARWGVGLAFARMFGTAFPYGTLFINLSGSFFLGWFLTVASARLFDFEDSWLRREHLHLALAVGFTGAYTTFSTYEWESHRLLSHGEELRGTLYLVGSVLAGLLAIRAGIWLGHPSG